MTTELERIVRRFSEVYRSLQDEAHLAVQHGGYIPLDDDETEVCVPLGLLRQAAELVPADRHEWECESLGEYDSLYRCSRCGRSHMESIDNPASSLPDAGCDA